MPTTPNQPKGQAQAQEEALPLQELLALCLAKWRWFAVSAAACLCLAALYILRTPPTYTRQTSILVKEDAKGSSSFSSELNSFADMGLFTANTNVNNELTAMQSPALIMEVARRLHLDMSYTVSGAFHRETLYGRSLPWLVTVSGLPDNASCAMTLTVEGDRVTLTDLELDGDDVDGEAAGRLRQAIKTPVGRVTVTPNTQYRPDPKDGNPDSPLGGQGEAAEMRVSRTGIVKTVEACQKKLAVALNGEKTTIIDLTYDDVSTQRAEDFLSTLTAVYNENWVKDKNQIAVSTSQFIGERLGVIERELGSVDSNISSYKSEHLIPDVEAVSKMYMDNANEAQNQALALGNQLYMARYIRSFVSAERNRGQLLPANSGIESPAIEAQIKDYNEKQLQRNSLIANSSAQNPMVRDLDEALSAMRSAIITSIDNQVSSLTTQIATLRGSEAQSTSRIASNPTQAKYLLSVERQQKVKESLYLFLLQKREENELSQAFTAYNTRVITPPTGKLTPTAPVSRNIILVALLIGLLLPVGVIMLRENMNTKVRGRKDIEKLTVPFLGEIPFCGKRKGRLPFRLPIGKKKTVEAAATGVIVREGSRNVVNEAFRVLRSNIDFMAGREGEHTVFVMTSFNPGSGKSFLTVNLAVSFAIKKKRVLVVDGDLRHGSTSMFVGSPATGLSDYLRGKAGDWRPLVVTDPGHSHLDILPIGTVPPNPTELLEDGRLATLVSEARETYDYVFLDCPPIDIVADTQIIEKLADRTIFVIRAGLLDRSMLPELESIYTEKRFKGLSLVLNGTESAGGRYGYRHGYYGSYGSYYGSQKEAE